MKFRSVEADGRTDRRKDMTNRKVAIPNFTNVLKILESENFSSW